jgi:hypothetical protein
MHCFEIWVLHGAKLLQIWFLEIISGEDLCNCVFTLGYGVSTSSTAVALWHTVYSSWNHNVDQTKALTLLNNTRLRSGKMWTGSLQCQFSIVLQCSSAASALHVLDDLGCQKNQQSFPVLQRQMSQLHPTAADVRLHLKRGKCYGLCGGTPRRLHKSGWKQDWIVLCFICLWQWRKEV